MTFFYNGLPLFNFTPHTIDVYEESLIDKPLSISSAGIIRLVKDQNGDTKKAAIFQNGAVVREIPVTKATAWVGLEITACNSDLLEGSAILVSMPVAEYIVDKGLYPNCTILGPNTGPESVVRDAQGNILGVREFIEYR